MRCCWFIAKISNEHSVLRFTAPPYQASAHTHLLKAFSIHTHLSCSTSCFPIRAREEQHIERARHAQMHTNAQVINQTVISNNSASLPLPHTPVEALVGADWWAVRATSWGPHEKPLLMGGAEEKGQQVHQHSQGRPPAYSHTTARGGAKTQSAIDKRMMGHTRTDANVGT